MNKPAGADKNKEVKDQILRAAKTLFAKKGYDGTSVRQICEEANVSLALVSYHFGGKENVFAALFDPLRHTLDAQIDLTDSLGALTDFATSFVLHRYEEYELINILQQELLMKSARLEMLTDVFLPSWEQLRVILLACREQRTIDYPSVDMAVNFVMGTLMYSITNPLLNPSQLKDSPKEAAGLAVRYILQGLGANTKA